MKLEHDDRTEQARLVELTMNTAGWKTVILPFLEDKISKCDNINTLDYSSAQAVYDSAMKLKLKKDIYKSFINHFNDLINKEKNKQEA